MALGGVGYFLRKSPMILRMCYLVGSFLLIITGGITDYWVSGLRE